jgi:hypothetical protein
MAFEKNKFTSTCYYQRLPPSTIISLKSWFGNEKPSIAFISVDSNPDDRKLFPMTIDNRNNPSGWVCNIVIAFEE